MEAVAVWDLSGWNAHTFAVGAGSYVVHNCGKYWEKPEELGQRVYKRDDLIDPHLETSDGRTNLHRMLAGDAPIGPDGEQIQQHHMLQMDDSPLAEVTGTFHRQYKRIIHINPTTPVRDYETSP
jgi:A nuclease of the HNH/ENDO VII superfamily with conserved LHH